MSKRKLNLLGWSDSSLSCTGFGLVAREILGRIYDTGEFNVSLIGINHQGDEHADKVWEDRASDVPYRVYSGVDLQQQQNGVLVPIDRMGRLKAIDFLKTKGVDVFFMMRDIWDMCVRQPSQQAPWMSSYFPLHIQLAKEAGINFRTLVHFPMEHSLQPDWAPMLDMIDYGYCFTGAGMKYLERWKDNIKYCPQGADNKTFKPLPPTGWGLSTIIGPGHPPYRDMIKNKVDFRRRKLNIPDPENAFVVVNVNRNQPRKDIRASMQSFAKFKQLVQETGGTRRPVLWMHMRPDDAFGDARKVAEEEGLIVDHDVFFPPHFNIGVGWTKEELNMLYNAADVYISSSVAEGFGLTPVEALMAGCPALVGGHSGHLDTVHYAGMPHVKITQPEIRDFIMKNSYVYPIDTQDMAQKLFNHYQDPNILKLQLQEHHKDFRSRFDWDNIFRDYWYPALQVIQEDIFGTPNRQKQNIKRYFFVCDEAFGDVLGASSALNSLKAQKPDAEIDFMTKNQFQDVLTDHPAISKIVPWDLNKLFDYPKENVLYPHAKIRHGSWANGPTHLMKMQAEMIGLPYSEPFIKPEPFDSLIDEFVPDQNKDVWPIITINTSSQGGKMIDLHKWNVIVFNILKHHPDIRIACVGGPNDMLPAGCLDFRFEPGTDKVLSYRKMAYLQSKAICHIGIDSGPGHSADAVDTPSFIFWGWTNSRTCKPMKYSFNITPHYATVCPNMGPCHGVSPRCGINQYERESSMKAPCLQSLNPAPVLDILLNVLDNTETIEETKETLKQKAKSIGEADIYAIPPAPKDPVGIRQKETQIKNLKETLAKKDIFSKTGETK